MPNLFQHLLSGASNVAKRAGDRMMPAPVEGLFSPEDLQQARRNGMLHLGLSLLGDTSGMGLGPALKQGVSEAQGAYGSALNDRAAQAAAAKQKNLLAMRAEIGKKYAPGPTDTAQDIMGRYPAMYADYMRVGDLEAAKNVEGIVAQQISKQGSSNLQTVQAGDRIYTFDPKTGTYVEGPERRMSADELREKGMDRALKQEQLETSRMLRQQSMAQAAGTAFLRQNQKLADSETLWSHWKASYDSAKDADPNNRQAAYKSALANYTRLVDPNQRSSIQMLHYLEQVMPSLVSRTKLTVQKLESGDFPPEVLAAMMHHAKNIHRGTINEYEARRAGRVKAMPQLDAYIPPTSDLFPSAKEIDSPESEAGGSGRVNKYLKGWGR